MGNGSRAYGGEQVTAYEEFQKSLAPEEKQVVAHNHIKEALIGGWLV